MHWSPLTSFLLMQVIVNTSRADVRFCVKTIPIKFEDVDKILALTREVNLMLKSNRFVTRKRAGPSCYVSRVGKIYGELVVSYETQLVGYEYFLFALVFLHADFTHVHKSFCSS
jgi:hypothetical protein